MIEPPLVYIDANPFIYAIEGDKALAQAIMDLFSLFRQGSGLGVTSELTLAEVLAKARPPGASSELFGLDSMERDLRFTIRYTRHTH